MLAIINEHFFLSSPEVDKNGGEEKSSSSEGKSDETPNDQPPQHGDLQTLQLIFRGNLQPILEFAEVNVSSGRSLLPERFFRYMTKGSPSSPSGNKESGGRKDRIENSLIRGKIWLDTTFDHLMDGCIALALKSIDIYKDDMLVVEVLAMFNNCLISDSGVLAVRGLKQLHTFVTNDLIEEGVTDDT